MPNDDFYNVIGPELTITFANLTEDQSALLARHLSKTGDEDALDADFTKALVPPLC